MNLPAIRTTDLHKRFWRKEVLQGLDLEVGNGETVVVLGVISEGCVESTVRGASYRDFYVVVAKDDEIFMSSSPKMRSRAAIRHCMQAR